VDEIADLEIGLYRWDADHYAVDVRYDAPGQPVAVRPRQSMPVKFDFGQLTGLALDPAAYGEALWQGLFADASVRETFAQCLTDAQQHRDAQGRPQPLPLRLRLYISPNSPELHGLRWETLRHAVDKSWLVTSERTLFSRYVISADWRPIRPAPDSPADLKALVLIADPSGLDQYKPGGRPLTPVDVAGEGARARKALQGCQVVEASRLAPPAPDGTVRRATLENLLAALRGGCDFVYLVCHGALRGDAILWLEDAQGHVDIVPGNELIARLKELPQQPRLVVLASCQSAGQGEPAAADDGALAALGPRLAEAGVPAVVAMQGNVTMATVEAFMPRFFQELLRDGQIDRALAVARGAVRARPDWWMPVLFLRLKSGNLWGLPAARERRAEQFTRWDALVMGLMQGNCTPILGTGVLEPLVGKTREIALRWAEAYRFPLAPQNRDDLPQVAQYLEVVQDRPFPRGELDLYLRRLLRRRFPEDLKDLPKTATLDELLVAAGLALQRRDPGEPHALLAALPCPVYVTTNPDSLLPRSLEAAKTAGSRPKKPAALAFGADEAASPPVPSEEAPLVYYLFGRLPDLDSIVLTEDDYFDYLINVSGKRRQVPAEVRRRLTKSSLLFVGFRLEEWDFRVLVRCINALEGSELLRNYAQVAVQLDPESGRFLDPDSARGYLERHTRFAGESVSIYWGKADEFLKELTRRWRARLAEDV
jgi:hypothetical protein